MRRNSLALPRETAGGTPRAEQGEALGVDRLLLFDVGGERCAISVGFLREVALPEALGASPDPANRECEMVMYRGLPIPAVDLATVFGYPGRRRTGESRVLVGEGAGRRFGLVVDWVDEVREASPHSFLRVPDGASSLPAACFRGMWFREDRVALVLDPAGLAALECVERAAAAPGPAVVGGVP